ncbi:polysaccharide lyase 6 family protein [Saccharicrinis fermentans]|nr:polysaccharide lyase 6 family protein [Saccharicrinis fermentans]
MKVLKRDIRSVNIRMVRLGLCFIIAITALCGVSVHATSYSVSSASEIADLSERLLAGDTVIMRSGTWIDQEIIFEGMGEEGKPIVLLVEESNGVVLSGTSTLRIAGEYLEVNGLRFENGYSSSGAVVEFRNGSSELASHSRLTNCTIVSYNPTDKDMDYKWVSVYGAYNRVDHCSFSGKEHSGTTLVVWLNDTPNYTQIDHNYFGSRPDLGYNGGETIRIGTSSNSMKESRAMVEFNLFEECDGEIEIISNKSCFNTYRYNTFRDCAGCLTLRHGNDCLVYGNFFFGNEKSSGGVRIIGERHQVYNNYFEGLKGDDYRSAICLMNGVPDSPLNRYFQVQDAVVIFNTIVGCKMPLMVGAGKDAEKSLAPVNCTFANNVIDKTSGSNHVVIEDASAQITWLGNVVNADEEEEELSDGFLLADPHLEYTEGMWRPASSSPLIDAAQGEFPLLTEDIDGQSRSEKKDIGCDEYMESEILISPLEKNEVGPYAYQEEPVLGIFNKAYQMKDMVKWVVDRRSICFSVNEASFLPINYSLYDVSGRIVNSGKITNLTTHIGIEDRNKILLARFVSKKQYYQSYKLLINNGMF